MIEDLIEDVVEAGIANPEAAERLGVGLLVVAGVLWLAVLGRLAWGWVSRRRRARPALVSSAPRRRPVPVPDPFVPRLDDSTRVHPAQAALTEVFPAAAFPDPWGAGVRRG